MTDGPDYPPRSTPRAMAKRKAVRSAPHEIERSASLLARLGALWMFLAALELGLSALIPTTTLRDGQLSLSSRFTLAAHGFSLLAVTVSIVGSLLIGAARFGRPGAHPFIRWTVKVLQPLAIWLPLLLYGASWALFWNTGVFLDSEAFAFLAPNPIQVFHWVYPPLAMTVIVSTILVAAVAGWWLPRHVAARPAIHRRVALAAGAAVAASLAAALVGGAAYGREPDDASGPKPLYAVARDDRTGPLLHGLADLQGRFSAAPPREPLAASVVTSGDIVRRPIISMEQYLAGVDRAAMKRWNVVMLQIESLRSDQLRAYGGARDVMPTLDALAKESRVFTNAYIQASHSNYADLVPLSSHYPMRSLQMYEYPENPPYPRVLVYDVLKALGYKTAIFSSQNERWGGMLNYHRPSSLDRLFHAETFSGPTYTPWDDLGFADWVKETKSAGSVDDRYTIGEAIRWIDEVKGTPFFLHANLQSSHVPYVVPDDFPHRFSPKELDFTIMWGRFPIDKTAVVKDRYADSLFYEDTQIARLFEHLRIRGLWDDTLIVVGGDNGEAFYEHGFTSHASYLFNEVMKVPMIVRAPGLEAGRDDRPAMFLDVPPSIFQLLGLPIHPSFQGISLFEPQVDPDRSIYMVVQTPLAFQSGIVRSGYKLLFRLVDRKYELYNLRQDPGELKNLVSSEIDLARDLTRRLRIWVEEQTRYYGDLPRQAREYPPIFKN